MSTIDTMPVFPITISVKKVPPVMLRKKHVLIVIQDTEGLYLMGAKHVYPPGIFRFVGGGVEKEEEFDLAAKRELKEELHVFPRSKEIHKLAEVIAHITDENGKKHQFTTHLYFFKLKDYKILPSSDLEDVRRFTEAEMFDLVQKYRTLPHRIQQNVGFSWFDYGQLYGKIHQIGIEEAKKLVKKARDFGTELK